MLSSFNRYVLIIALVALIISITAYAYSIRYSLQEYVFPPNISTCPDYWDISKNLNNTSCIYRDINPITNTLDYRGNESITWTETTKSISLPKNINNKSFYCDAYDWSSINNISWNGITNSSQINENKCK